MYETGDDADVEWYVIDFGYGSAQRGMLDKTSYTDSSWGRADVTLSPSVYTKRMTMFFHSLTFFAGRRRLLSARTPLQIPIITPKNP